MRHHLHQILSSFLKKHRYRPAIYLDAQALHASSYVRAQSNNLTPIAGKDLTIKEIEAY